MTRHDDARLWEYAARELDAADAYQVELHLEDCARCREQLASVQVAREALEVSRAALPLLSWDGVDLAVSGAVERRLNARPRSTRSWSWRLRLSVGLVAVAAVALAIVSRPRSEAPLPQPLVQDAPPAPPVARVAMASGLERIGVRSEVLRDGSQLEAGDVVTTTRGGWATVRLADSSAVRIAGSTELRFNRVEAGDVALELERGRVAIRASHVERKAFVVSAGGLLVQVVGTVFEVSSTKALTEVAVSEGRVRVELPDGEREIVSAGQRLTVDVLGRVGRANALTPAAKRALDEVASFGDPDRPSEPLPAVAPAAGGVRSEPRLLGAPPGSRTLPRLDPQQARARRGRLPDEVGGGEPSPPAPVTEAPVTQRLEPHTELIVEPPLGASTSRARGEAPQRPEPEVDAEWALPPTATAQRGPQPGAGVIGGAVGSERDVAQDLESIFMSRAEAALERGGCGRFLVGLEDIAQDDTRSPKSELARALRARCFNSELRPRQALNEYRKYLEEYPRGRFVLEAREALGAQ